LRAVKLEDWKYFVEWDDDFHELRYQKVNVTIHAFNEGSLALHKKLGFQEEGKLRRMIFAKGEFFDEVILGMTAEEFSRWQETG
jgi:RimJ/RimL family protein N-acetyltransferase